MSKSNMRQRFNFVKLLLTLNFLGTIPEEKMGEEDDIRELSKESAKSFNAFLENPSIIAVFKTAQDEGLIGEKGELTKAGAALAQKSLNARFSNNINFLEQFEKQGLGGKIAALAAWKTAFETFLEEVEEFKAEGTTKELFQEAIDLLSSCI